ncbi:MAG: hypothetical protein HOQ02_10350 [Lysobacter sp.]|nr:hypothetical protein [Lysobacter sp.]
MKLTMPIVPIGWRVAGVLAILFGLSAWWNVHQWKQAITAPLRLTIDSQKQAIDDAASINASERARIGKLQGAIDGATSRLRNAGHDYDAAATAQPLAPDCAPGQFRQDAINRALGAQLGATK